MVIIKDEYYDSSLYPNDGQTLVNKSLNKLTESSSKFNILECLEFPFTIMKRFVSFVFWISILHFRFINTFVIKLESTFLKFKFFKRQIIINSFQIKENFKSLDLTYLNLGMFQFSFFISEIFLCFVPKLAFFVSLNVNPYV